MGVKECRERKADQGLNSEETFSWRGEPNGHEREVLVQESEYLEWDDPETQGGFIKRRGGQQQQNCRDVKKDKH